MQRKGKYMTRKLPENLKQTQPKRIQLFKTSTFWVSDTYSIGILSIFIYSSIKNIFCISISDPENNIKKWRFR